MRAIETRYNGRLFRSRLEARYAVLFDALAIKWDYEPEGFVLADGTRYLPDFWLHDPRHVGWGYWVEIKPFDPSAREINALRRLGEESEHKAWFFWGHPDHMARAGEAAATMRDGPLSLAAPLVTCAAQPLTGRSFNTASQRALSARFEFHKSRSAA